MPLYPVSLCLAGRLCIVIGAGEVAERKIESLLAAGAKVRVIAPDDVTSGAVEHIRRRYRHGDLSGAFLAIAATDDSEINEAVHREAVERNILVNVVDNPPLCTFFVPAVVTRGDLQISVSTGGKCPALAKKLRIEMESQLGPEMDEYVKTVDRARQEIIRRFSEKDRKKMLNRLLDDELLLSLVRERGAEGAWEGVLWHLQSGGAGDSGEDR